MKLKDFMIKSLTELLEDKETLMHPIYGMLQQANTQYYAFFGFTENFLLIALLSATGKKITYTTRVPLDIKSINIKQSPISRQYTIDISFNKGAPCRLLAHSKVLGMDSQKENFPLFLEYLKEIAPKQHNINLKDIDGKKIRWQLFTVFICFLLSFLPMIIIVISVLDLKAGRFSFSVITEAIPLWLFICSPLFALAIINRFLFGKIICVLNSKGLYLENDFIPWKKIKKIEYYPEIPSKYKVTYTYASLTISDDNTKEYKLDITHFPFYGLKAIKKFAPHVKFEIPKGKKLSIVFFMLLPSVMGLILALTI